MFFFRHCSTRWECIYTFRSSTILKTITSPVWRRFIRHIWGSRLCELQAIHILSHHTTPFTLLLMLIVKDWITRPLFLPILLIDYKRITLFTGTTNRCFDNGSWVLRRKEEKGSRILWYSEEPLDAWGGTLFSSTVGPKEVWRVIVFSTFGKVSSRLCLLISHFRMGV